MTEVAKIERYFCTKCTQKTKHHIRAEHVLTDHDPRDGTSFTQVMNIAECCGCEHLAFVKRTHFSEHVDYDHHPITGEPQMTALWDEAIYPPATYRSAPTWFDDLPDPTLRAISEEIYKSLQTESLYLATFGSRTLMDRLIVLTVGDKGNFPKGLKALQDAGKLSQHERDILKPIIEAGHAAAHRGWAPNREQISTILDTVEGLIHRLLVLPKMSEELEDAVPGRHAAASSKTAPVTVQQKIDKAPKALRATFNELDKVLRTLGTDVAAHYQKHYVAYKRNRNFGSVQIYNQKKVVKIYLNLDPDTVDLTRDNIRDVRQVGHFGTGDLELTLKTKKDIKDNFDLISDSYVNS